MSQENVEIVRESLEAYNAGEMERLRGLYHPEVILRMPTGWPESGPFVGRDAVFEQFGRIREAWDRDSFELLSDVFHIGDRVLVRVAFNAAGRGPEGRLELTNVYTVRGGLIFGLEFFPDHYEALEAAGLQE